MKVKELNHIRIWKLSVGCILAYLAASNLELNYATAVITITLLSIQHTRRDTVSLAFKRVCSFGLGSVIAAACFILLKFSVFSLFLYLVLMIAACMLLKVEEGLTMTTVLMLHLWNTGAITARGLFNEAALMTIGILLGFLMNSYMPGQIRQIRKDQLKIDDMMQQILFQAAGAIQEKLAWQPDWERLEQLLEDAKKRAEVYRKNSFRMEDDYFLRYVEMREKQAILLRKIFGDTSRLLTVPKEGKIVAGFIRAVSDSFHELNNAKALLSALAVMRSQFRQGKLPGTRKEFESRAVLYEMVHDLQEFLRIKRRFAEEVTEGQKKLYWQEHIEKVPAEEKGPSDS